MAERYKRLFELEQAQYVESAPLIISAGVLLEDKLGHTTLAQFKFKSISNKTITAVKLRIQPFNVADECLEPIEYIYQNLRVERDDDFGYKTAIVIPDNAVNYFEAKVVQVYFADGTVWDDADNEWTSVKAPRTIIDAYGDEELATQFAIRYGDDCTYLPQEDRDLWFCACGLINHSEEPKCHGCRRVFSALMGVNFNSLRSESLQRQEQERQIESEDKAEQLENRKKAMKLSFIIAPILVVLVLLIALVPKYLAQKSNYAKAQSLLSAGKYDLAQQAFIDLGDYADSADLAQYEVPYAKARYIMDCAQNENVDGLLLLGMKRSELAEDETISLALYKAAVELYTQLGDYKDSSTQLEFAKAAVQSHHDSLKQAEYEKATALLESGNYLAARDTFTALADFSNSAEMAKEALYQRAVALYSLTEQFPMKGISSRISDSLDEDSVFYITEPTFAELGSNISASIRDICREDGVEVNIADAPDESFVPVCEDIGRLFEQLGDYKDSAEYAAKALAAGDFTKPFFDLCASGQLYEAYLWLEAYDDYFEGRDEWVAFLVKFVPYCGAWQLSKGDSTLIPLTSGIQAELTLFKSIVVMEDFNISLKIFTVDNEEQQLELPLSMDNGVFTTCPDGVNTFVAALSEIGNFNYSLYNNTTGLVSSCEYVRVA